MGRERIYYPTGAQKKGLYTEGRQWMTRDGVEYIGSMEAARALGVTHTTIRKRTLSPDFPNYQRHR